VSGSGGLQELERIVFEILRGELPEVGPDFTPQSDLVAAGLDSMAVVRVLLCVEEQTGIWVDEAELTQENLASAEALARCVHGLREPVA
jgi:diaminopimelate decarboxylase